MGKRIAIQTEWIALRTRLLRAGIQRKANRKKYGQMHGHIRRLADAIGVHSSYVHRYFCTRCKHGLEPCYTFGIKIKQWADNQPKWLKYWYERHNPETAHLAEFIAT